MFSCEFCKIFKNTYFYRPLVAASSDSYSTLQIDYSMQVLKQISRDFDFGIIFAQVLILMVFKDQDNLHYA